MKISGKHFKRGMNDNTIIIEKDYILIHSSEGEVGIYRKEVNEFGSQSDDKISFNLKDKDFALLNKFNELDVSVNGDTIQFASGASKFKIQNYDVTLNRPDTKGSIELSVDINLLKKCMRFASSTKKESCGVLIYPNCVAGSTGYSIYKKSIVTGTSLIHVPLNFMKVLENDEYALKSTDRFVLATRSGEIVYSALYEQKTNALENYDPTYAGYIDLEKQNLIEQLHAVSLFSKYAWIEIKKDKILISSAVDEGQYKEYSASIKCTDTNIAEYKKCFDAPELVNVLSSVDDSKIYLHNIACMCKGENEIAVLMVLTNAASIDMKMKEEEN